MSHIDVTCFCFIIMNSSSSNDKTCTKWYSENSNVGNNGRGKNDRGKNGIGKNARGKNARGKNARGKVVKMP